MIFTHHTCCKVYCTTHCTAPHSSLQRVSLCLVLSSTLLLSISLTPAHSPARFHTSAQQPRCLGEAMWSKALPRSWQQIFPQSVYFKSMTTLVSIFVCKNQQRFPNQIFSRACAAINFFLKNVFEGLGKLKC